MDIELFCRPQGTKLKIWTDFLARAGLSADETISQTVLVWDGDTLIASGSREGNILKCIAVDEARRGEDLTATVLGTLRQEAFREGHKHLFLYTKPSNKYLFSSLFFYPIAQTSDVLLMENQRNGIQNFLQALSDNQNGNPQASSENGIHKQPQTVGAIVMNCNPFTLGHRYLVETAAGECDKLYVFVLSEDKSFFSAVDRMEMVRLGTRDLSNVTVLPTGPYLISSATFPTYFIKEREKTGQIQCLLDIEVFVRYFAPHFHITHRYVGTEPLSPMTAQYNEALRTHLPGKGIILKEIPRLEAEGTPISANAVRAHIKSGNMEAGKLSQGEPHAKMKTRDCSDAPEAKRCQSWPANCWN